MAPTAGTAQHVQGNTEWVTTRDGRRLHTMVLPGPGTEGEAPTVVFEAGAAATRSSWALVQPAVGDLARAVVYDRSGLGRSPADPGSRTLHHMADDLEDLLDHFGPGPYILVGHSAGGPLVRLAASRRPERISGLVLVDPTDEGADVLFSPTFRRAERVVIAVNLLLARIGLLGRLYGSVARPLPDDARRDMERDGFTVGVVRAHRDQARTYLDELAAFRDTPPDLTGVPVTVISGGLPGNGMNKAVRRAANEAHARSAAASSPGKHVVAARSGHYVPLTEPDVVIEEIGLLVTGASTPR
ncbi:alpha/beta fold hydrolase [Streptomyces sp. NBC_01012]|uniref:alpha/beta hydrolase n=1 Tax=Streptomyces sp. NBC_01012 TaxID=2903717 RepID=UPI0038632C24|nr:alpha/beta hydrolase [Streptomyces sp. NBC_01012]